MTATRAIGNAGRRGANQWARLATVARERASEQSARAVATSNAEVASAHLQQEVYLVKLAEVYEGRARDGAASA